jgi:ATP-dependent DNA ligase
LAGPDDGHSGAKAKASTGATGAARHPLLHRYIDSLDPTNVEHPPAGEDWIHEIKFDGYRHDALMGARYSVVS